ncbi:MAG: branched-chain amino acid ABC transporter permease [Chloroflexota bacterium]|nr:branched-chain amino acid ABC transporter permease [Chloroflexota bacterium]
MATRREVSSAAPAKPTSPRHADARRSLVAVALLLALLLILVAVAERSFNAYRLQLVTLVAINAVVAVALTLTSGFTGVFSLGQIGFMAIGAYVGALMTIPPQWKDPMFLPGLPSWLATLDLSTWSPQLALLAACLAGGIVAAVVAAIVGAPLMRLSGHYVAVATMGFLIIVNSVATNWDTVTRGARGLSQIPTETNAWVAYGWMVVTIYAVWRLRISPYGRAMIASRENVIAARAVGVNVWRTRLLAFVVGAFFTGVAGSLLAHQIGTVAPTAFYFQTTFTIIIMVVLGGMGSITGAVVGAAILTLAPEYLRDLEDGVDLGFVSIGALYGISQIILAIGFILVMIFRPQGLFGDRELSFQRRSRSRGAAGVEIRDTVAAPLAADDENIVSDDAAQTR